MIFYIVRNTFQKLPIISEVLFQNDVSQNMHNWLYILWDHFIDFTGKITEKLY